MNSSLLLLFASLLAAPPIHQPPGQPSNNPPVAATDPTPSASLDCASCAPGMQRLETRLLHQSVRAIDLGANLRIFDPRSRDWLRTASSDPPAARVLVVYLWTTATQPTASGTAGELPWLREAARRIEAYHGGDVRFLFIAEGVTATEMAARVNPLERPPNLPFFLDADGNIAESLRQAMPGAELPMPITLLLDEQYIVRQAMVGSLAFRRSELVNAISDLLRQVRAVRGQKK
jgi:hypothetical protein